MVVVWCTRKPVGLAWIAGPCAACAGRLGMAMLMTASTTSAPPNPVLIASTATACTPPRDDEQTYRMPITVRLPRPGPRHLFQWNSFLVLREPYVECLKRRIKGSGNVDVACARERLREVAIDLKHVPQVLGPGEAEAAVCLGRHRVVRHVTAQGPRERRCHLRACQMFPGDADRFTDIFAALLEDPVRTFADVFRGHARQLLVPHREGDRQCAVGTLLRSHPEVDQVLPVERRQQKRGWHPRLRKQ